MKRLFLPYSPAQLYNGFEAAAGSAYSVYHLLPSSDVHLECVCLWCLIISIFF